MLVLFDQGTPVGIRDFLAQHTVKTAREHDRVFMRTGSKLKA